MITAFNKAKLYTHKIKYLFIVCLLSVFLSYSQSTKPIGINLTSVEYWSPEFVFTDAFKRCNSWRRSVPSDVNGYPLQVTEVEESVRAPLLVDLPDGTFPEGDFRLVVEGTGRVKVNIPGRSEIHNTPVNTIIIDVTGRIFIYI